MPELPEVETVCRGLAMKMEGRVLTRVEQRRPNLRIPFPERMVERLTGRRVVTIRRRAKYILIHLDDDQVLIVHLGMSGRMTIGQDLGPPGAHDHVLLTTDDGSDIRFNDARRFGLMAMTGADALDSHPLLASLGPEPLGNEFNAETLSRALKSKITPIKSALLDQTVVAGLGNIYVCEALFRAGISPKRIAATVAGRRAERLVPVIREVLTEAIAAGGSTLRDYVQASGELGYFQHQFAVYDREGRGLPRLHLRHIQHRRGGADRSGQPLDFLLSTTPALMYQFRMPHHPVLTSAVLAALLLAASPFGVRVPGIHPAQAQAGMGGAFVEGIDDLPLMPGLVGMADQSLVFDKPDGRIVQAVATGRVQASAVRSFYADTAPQLGWKSGGRGALHARRRVAADRADRPWRAGRRPDRPLPRQSAVARLYQQVTRSPDYPARPAPGGGRAHPRGREDMPYENILVETHGHVGLIKLNRPKALNALSDALVTRACRRRRCLRGGRRDRLHRPDRQRAGFRRRRRHQGDGQPAPTWTSISPTSSPRSGAGWRPPASR